ncbi:hypothetical protein HPB51_017533 [Rhipicephalus microplus]|uniref:Kelch-like protein diablo n=1 Tax=Rhipicephalus microplus TaxID=6941 RepID=A0A9J6F4W0_RHIMP|nr:hypothetical protein HPB51_017533 [Rhipicephalus microplus]
MVLPGPPTQVPCGSCGVVRNLERWLPRMPYQMLFVVGGFNECGERDTVETYDPRAGRAYHGIALLQNRLYVVGGVRENSFLRSCDCFDLESCTWQSCSTMKIARGYVSVVALEDYVYAIGGCNAGGCIASVERYSPSSNQWTLVRAMTRQRSNGSACAFKGKLRQCRRIYVSGGVNGQKVHASVEVYTPSQDTWCVVKRLPSPRCCHQMVVFDGRIYVIGGYNGRRRLQSVLCSGDGEEPLTWHQMNPIRSCRSSFATAIFNGNLYIIGGYDGTNIIAEVERYCPNSDSWREVAPLNEACFAIAACSVKSLNVCKHFSTNAER